MQHTSRYICRGCIQILKKRRSLLNQLANITTFFSNLHCGKQDSTKSLLKRSSNVTEEGTETITKKIRDESVALLTSSPVHQAPRIQTVHEWPPSPIFSTQPQESGVHPTRSVEPSRINRSDGVDVCVKVKWPSQDRERKLPEDLTSLGKMLLRGTYKQIAAAVWKNPKIKKELQGFMAHDIDQECNQLCSKKNPSILRKTDKDSLLSFTMQKLYQEVEEKAPLLHSLLHAASHNKSSRAKQTKEELMNAGTAMAAAICLRNRSKNMIAVQLIVTIILYHNNWLVSDLFHVFA